MSFPEMIRNVAVVGHLHHGKTALMDMLVFETHKLVWDADRPVCGDLICQLYIALMHFDPRHGIQILTYCPENAKCQSSLRQCLWFCRQPLGNPIYCI